MNAKKILLAIIVAAAAIAAIFLVLPKDKAEAPNASTSPTAQNPSDGTSGEAAGLPQYTLAQVAKHDKESDCWTVINGSVYDLTEFIPNHEGEDEILRACGIDATSLFTQRRTADGEAVGSGVPHSSAATAQLAQLKIGEIKQ